MIYLFNQKFPPTVPRHKRFPASLSHCHLNGKARFCNASCFKSNSAFTFASSCGDLDLPHLAFHTEKLLPSFVPREDVLAQQWPRLHGGGFPQWLCGVALWLCDVPLRIWVSVHLRAGEPCPGLPAQRHCPHVGVILRALRLSHSLTAGK